MFVLTTWNVVCAFKVHNLSLVESTCDPLKRSLSAASKSFAFGNVLDENDLTHVTSNCHRVNLVSDGVDVDHSQSGKNKCVILDQQNALKKSESDIIVESNDDSKQHLGKIKSNRFTASRCVYFMHLCSISDLR